jgi:hypothetical protein
MKEIQAGKLASPWVQETLRKVGVLGAGETL